jgi:hypothetical protein
LSANAYASAEILQDSKILFSLTAEDLSGFKDSKIFLLLKIFQDFAQDF